MIPQLFLLCNTEEGSDKYTLPKPVTINSRYYY